MSHSGLKLSALTKVGLVFLVVALSVASVYLSYAKYRNIPPS